MTDIITVLKHAHNSLRTFSKSVPRGKQYWTISDEETRVEIEDILSRTDGRSDIPLPAGDYELVDGEAWLTVSGCFSIRIKAHDEGVACDIYRKGAEDEDSIVGTWALYAEAKDDE